jgi:hypothetical protein
MRGILWGATPLPLLLVRHGLRELRRLLLGHLRETLQVIRHPEIPPFIPLGALEPCEPITPLSALPPPRPLNPFSWSATCVTLSRRSGPTAGGVPITLNGATGITGVTWNGVPASVINGTTFNLPAGSGIVSSISVGWVGLVTRSPYAVLTSASLWGCVPSVEETGGWQSEARLLFR